MKVHLIWGAVVAVALVLFAIAERHAGAADARADAYADSLNRVGSVLKVKVDSGLAHQRRDSIADALFLRAQAGQRAALVAQRTAAESLHAAIERRLADSASLRAAFDSLEALHQAREDSLTAQRERAIARFTGAALARDSLAGLVRQLQVQQQGLSTALAQASRKPIWDLPGIKVAEAGLALLGVARLLGH